MRINKLILLSALIIAPSFQSGAEESELRRESDGTCIVNTTTLCNVKGFRGKTPVEVYIKNGVIMKVVPLKNDESPNYFEKVKKNLIPLYRNLKIGKAKKLSKEVKIDGCTGATYSTNAIQQNIKSALEYYEKNHKIK